MHQSVRFTYRLGGALVALVVALLAFGAGSANAETPSIVYQNLHEGDVLGQGPYVVQMCFAEPINTKKLDQGGDFDFRLNTAENEGHGLTIVFQPDAFGVAVYPGSAPSVAAPVETATGGRWTFHYRVVDADDNAPAEGDIRFAVEDGAGTIPRATPPSCLSDGRGSPSQGLVVLQPGETETPRPTRTPRTTEPPAPSDTDEVSSESPGVSGSSTTTATPVAGGDDNDDDGGSDALVVVLVVIGVVGVIGGTAAALYLMRRRRSV